MMENLVGFIPIVVLILLLIVMIKLRRGGYLTHRKAQALEKQGNYKEACYVYAIAQLNCLLPSKYARKKIKCIWDKYGPFDYLDELERIRRDGDTPEKCDEAGHFLTMSIIEEIVAK